MSELPDIKVDVPDIDQVGLVVEDLEDGMERYSSLLGVAPWDVYTYEPPTLTDTTYRGEEAEYGMRLCIGYAGDMMIELIEPTIDPNIYSDHLQEHGEGIHHIACFSFEEPKAVVEEFEKAGMPVLQSGFAHGANFWYLDTAEKLNGVILETGDRSVRDAPLPEPEAVYPPDAGH
jgi:hypothetical protein